MRSVISSLDRQTFLNSYKEEYIVTGLHSFLMTRTALLYGQKPRTGKTKPYHCSIMKILGPVRKHPIFKILSYVLFSLDTVKPWSNVACSSTRSSQVTRSGVCTST
ncbi:hypothetical protein M514_24372 [Trichuris suis]|uniref:Uncharacterized protein n=1 Tax=Trichuris suis TaxID=68888 RepID=A0A085N1V0_9BILA|nr:hypothetical protein M514_24372 [Trichuris suis]